LARLAALVEAPAATNDPYRPGTQTKLREVQAVVLPKIPDVGRGPSEPTPALTKLIYAQKHNLLFAMSGARVWVFDLKTNREGRGQAASNRLFDISLSPDEEALYAADFGAGDNSRPSHVHRFDLATRAWETRKVPGVAGKVKAIDANRLLLLEPASWTVLTLNRWEADRPAVTQLSRYSTGWGGDIAYDPVRRLAYHGSDISGPALVVRLVDGDKLISLDDGPPGSAVPGGGGSVVLSPDRAWLYHGAVQVSVPNVERRRSTFPEVIVAASRDVAFGERGYYRETDGAPLGKWSGATSDADWRAGAHDPRAAGPAVAVSPDDRSVWMIDRDKNVVRQFAIEGEK
jgi:hypothetical protein